MSPGFPSHIDAPPRRPLLASAPARFPPSEPEAATCIVHARGRLTRELPQTAPTSPPLDDRIDDATLVTQRQRAHSVLPVPAAYRRTSFSASPASSFEEPFSPAHIDRAPRAVPVPPAHTLNAGRRPTLDFSSLLTRPAHEPSQASYERTAEHAAGSSMQRLLGDPELRFAEMTLEDLAESPQLEASPTKSVHEARPNIMRRARYAKKKAGEHDEFTARQKRVESWRRQPLGAAALVEPPTTSPWLSESAVQRREQLSSPEPRYRFKFDAPAGSNDTVPSRGRRRERSSRSPTTSPIILYRNPMEDAEPSEFKPGRPKGV